MNENFRLATEWTLSLVTLAAMGVIAYDMFVQDIGDEKPLLWIALLSSMTNNLIKK
jgi:hypothetical protein